MATGASSKNYSKETNNHKQGRSGSKVPMTSGPAVGRTSGNRTRNGGITRPTKGNKM